MKHIGFETLARQSLIRIGLNQDPDIQALAHQSGSAHAAQRHRLAVENSEQQNHTD